MSPKMWRILVTGVGGDLGQAIVKCLRLMEMPVQILGCDASLDNVGAAFVSDFFVVPPANDVEFPQQIANICRKKDVQAIIPGSEPEIFCLSRAVSQDGLPLNAVLVCQEYSWLEIYGDKLSCFRALNKNVKIAKFADGSDKRAVNVFIKKNMFPCVVKSRRSWGSKSLSIAYDKEQLLTFLRDTQDPIAQEFINNQYGEFSVGVFACEDFTKAIAFKRELGPIGASWYADNHDQDSDVLDYTFKIAKITGLRGSCNVQVRKGVEGVRLLEINPRFSSLVAARAACGFRDLEWSLLMAMGMSIPNSDVPFKPIQFRRYFHEMINFGGGYACLDEWTPLHLPMIMKQESY